MGTNFKDSYAIKRLLYQTTNFSSVIRLLLNPQIVEPDINLGLIPGSTCIAFKKEADDTRNWDFYREF